MRHLTNREIWGKIQEWRNAEEESNPTAIQRISNVTDFVDEPLDPQEVEKNAQRTARQAVGKRRFHASPQNGNPG